MSSWRSARQTGDTSALGLGPPAGGVSARTVEAAEAPS